MTNGSNAGSARTPARSPKLLWVVGIVALLWNSFGAFDYTMTQTRNAAYLKMMTPEQVAYIETFPAWAVAGWALGVWGGVAGSLLLLARKRLAVPVYLVSLLGALVSQTYTFVFSRGLEVMGGGAAAAILPLFILIVALGLFLYARSLAHRGVLA